MNTDQLVKMDRACELLSLSRGAVEALILRGEIRRVKIGRAVRIPLSEIDRYIRSWLEPVDSIGNAK